MSSDFNERANLYHRRLPGLLRAMLLDYGLSNEVIDRREIGWDGRRITVPIRARTGQVIAFERWEGDALGAALDPVDRVDLFGWDVLSQAPGRVFVCEGVFESLIAESQGLPAVAATGSGRFFKAREWVPHFAGITGVVVAMKKGERVERLEGLRSRDEIRARVVASLPKSRTLNWPELIGPDGGFFEFFVSHGRSVEELERLVSAA
jgi:hypothetical protein